MNAVQRIAESKGVITMSSTTSVPDFASPPIPVREVLPWIVFGVLLLLALYFVGAEEGATSIIPGMYVHEFVHDGRHLLAFPCH
jgi:Probable cobalt transporter subunit (CbtB)